MSDDNLLTIQDVAEMLGMTEAWVIERTGKNATDPIPSFKLGKYRRYRKDEVEDWLRRQGTAPEKAA